MHYVFNDLVIQEDNCNLACEYCLTGQSLFRAGHEEQKIFDPPRPSSCLPGTPLGERLRAMVDATADQRIPVLKLSGGEVLLVRGMAEFIREVAERYETVVVLTNGVLLDPRTLAILREAGNVVIQLSLDSTRYDGNRYRVPSLQVHDRIIRRLDEVLESGLPVEIYTVLNDRSIDTLEETLEDLKIHAGRLVLFPFPIRGPDRQRFFPRPEQHDRLWRVLERADEYREILPDPAYLARLERFFREGGRSFACHLPRVAFTSFDDGQTTSCPNIWFNRAGNLLEVPASEVFREMEGSRFRRLLLAPRPRVDACRACFTPWDSVSLYFQGVISLDDLARIPVYRGERTRARLMEARAEYLREFVHA